MSTTINVISGKRHDVIPLGVAASMPASLLLKPHYRVDYTSYLIERIRCRCAPQDGTKPQSEAGHNLQSVSREEI